MPKRSRPRSVAAEDALARRITAEREAKGWSYVTLAVFMTNAGCPMDASSIYKIEKGNPRRRITVDEFVAFSRVLDVDLDDLLIDPALLKDKRFQDLLSRWLIAAQSWAENQEEMLDARRKILSLAKGDP